MAYVGFCSYWIDVAIHMNVWILNNGFSGKKRLKQNPTFPFIDDDLVVVPLSFASLTLTPGRVGQRHQQEEQLHCSAHASCSGRN